jgi:dolichol-phosphate mannosyltransferase
MILYGGGGRPVARGEIGEGKQASIDPAGERRAAEATVSVIAGGDAGGAVRTMLAVLLGLGIDLTTTLTLVLLGWTLGTSNLVGFLAGGAGYLAARKHWRRAGTLREAHSGGWAAGIPCWVFVVTLALALRGGAVATGLAYGLPVWAAILVGLGVAWGAAGALQRLLATRSEPSAAVRWKAAVVGILASVFALHLLYLKVLPLTPQEAYYWNYSIRPDLGYLDHPPMVAWLIALAEATFGQGVASLRLVSLAAGVAIIFFVHRLARELVDPVAALLAAGLAAVIPYLFFAAGAMTTPDASLAAAWAAVLWFLHRALVEDDRRAWYGVGIAMGLGLLSKYTIITLGAGAVAFCVLDRRARAWFRRPEPYLAVLIAALLFVPVIHWNHAHDWASFRFQSGGRFGEETQFSLHEMLGNILIVATPLPLLVLPLLFVDRWTGHPGRFPEPAHACARNRLFVSCVVLIPLAVFAWSALRHPPRLNWTGPIWIATLPLLAWTIVRADAVSRFSIGPAMRWVAGKVIVGLLVLYSVFSYYMVLGLPGAPYPRSIARATGWPEATVQLHGVQDRILRETGTAPVFVGMDKYNIASQMAFFGTRNFVGADQTPLTATSSAAFSRQSLMFGFWDPPERFRGRTLVMVAPSRKALGTERLAPRFRELEDEVYSLILANSGPGGDGQPIAEYFYRIGRGYLPLEDR